MKRYSLLMCMAVGALFASVNAQAANPGQSAERCLDVSTNSNRSHNLIFKNRCSYQIFVVWCGDLKYSKKECGDGPRNTYYTQSANIRAYGEKATTLKSRGTYEYASCKGKIGFDSKGIEHSAYNNGRYRCTR
ncbi:MULTISPECIES: hypothetical protein [Marinomonas]|uniref:hypothetical protein n=1 Tax=Marinomonas TaxID=28253 RepID=UPI001055620C|nr:hypothetical protein [Marinomonas sp. KMM3893]